MSDSCCSPTATRSRTDNQMHMKVGAPRPADPSSLPLSDYWEQLAAALPEFSPEEQRHAVTLYQELAKGEPVAPEGLGRALGVPAEAAQQILDGPPIQSFVYPDSEGRVIGFGGLAVAPTEHRFEVDGRALWTWCAWDSLFIPRILGKTARVKTKDPQTGEPIRLVVTPEGVDSVEPDSAVVSFLVADSSQFNSSAANVMATFCHLVFFFASPDSGALWTAEHDGTFLYSMDDAFELGRLLNDRNFGVELARRGG